ncbi:MAG: glycosyltransferase family 1 protein [Bacteroidetes bacterium]|nr:glycosyltransferase family 1 protein [Bacteroidota bacterium]MDA0888620.1 glycosyltransferase family 1 protein [Bacteroidota bacterium]MDA1085010.1 glycosyltransferase family 1 protein [Bacteroidota bacterium]
MRIGYDAKRIFHNASGLGNYSRDLVRILATYYPKNHYHLYNPKKQKLNRWKPLPNTIEKQPKGIWRCFHSLWRQGPIVRQLKNDGIDIFHGLSGELPKALDMPSVVTVHDLIFYRYPELYTSIDVEIHKRKVKHAVKTASKIVAISEQTKADLIEFMGVPAKNIEVIYQGCHPIFKTNFTEKALNAVAKKHQLPEKFVLYVGTLEARKNALSIAKALKDTNYYMVFVGKVKAYGEALKKYVNENNMSSRALFIENIDLEDLAGIYQNATVFCYPSFFEGFGIPIIEALYSGVPLITTKGGCFSEAGGPSSIYIDPQSETELLTAVESLYAESHESRKNRIESGLNYAQKFNDDVLAKQWNKLYKSLLT